MRIENSIQGAYLYWNSEEENVFVTRLLNPTLSERQKKSKAISPSSAEGLYKFIQQSGFKVEFINSDLISQAKTTFWKHMLVNGPQKTDPSVIQSFIDNTGIELRSVQQEALFKMINSGITLNALICGSGKTLVTLLYSFFHHKHDDKKVLTIIASPVSCMREYKKEIKNFRGHFEDLSIEEIYGSTVAEMNEKIIAATSDILVVSLNSLEKLAPTIQEKIASHDGKTIFVVEEGHNVKEVTSSKSKGAQMIAPLAERVVVNTATPMPKGPSDIRGVLSLVGLPQPVDSYSGGIPAKDFEVLKGVTFVSDEDDIPYAPLKTTHMEYRDLTELTEKMTEVVRREILQGNKVIVFCSTNAGLKNVWDSFPNVNKTALSGSYYVEDCTKPELKSGRSYEHQQAAINDFNNNPDCKLLIANYKVGSTGVNLQHSGAKTAFFFEISNNGADFFQARYRIRRPFIFPEDGFTYYFARSTELKKRRNEDRQFAKIANQQALLADIKRLTRGA